MTHTNHTAVRIDPWFRRTWVISTIALITGMMPAGAQSISEGRGRITELRIDIDDYVPYNYDFFDPARFATLAHRTPAPPAVPFGQILIIGDIVAVDGKPAKGVFVLRGTNLFLTTDINVTPPGYPPAGRLAIADVARSHIEDVIWEILQPDGTPIGTIMASGFARGVPPPGAPAEQRFDNLTITGGTGAFFAVRGQGGLIDVGHPRQASVAEAPAERRTLGGAKRSYILKLLWPVLDD